MLETAARVASVGAVIRASGEMADALASGASVRKDVGVQVPPRPLENGDAIQRLSDRRCGDLRHPHRCGPGAFAAVGNSDKVTTG
jgi:hypothetical protein